MEDGLGVYHFLFLKEEGKPCTEKLRDILLIKYNHNELTNPLVKIYMVPRADSKDLNPDK